MAGETGTRLSVRHARPVRMSAADCSVHGRWGWDEVDGSRVQSRILRVERETLKARGRESGSTFSLSGPEIKHVGNAPQSSTVDNEHDLRRTGTSLESRASSLVVNGGTLRLFEDYERLAGFHRGTLGGGEGSHDAGGGARTSCCIFMAFRINRLCPSATSASGAFACRGDTCAIAADGGKQFDSV